MPMPAPTVEGSPLALALLGRHEGLHDNSDCPSRTSTARSTRMLLKHTANEYGAARQAFESKLSWRAVWLIDRLVH